MPDRSTKVLVCGALGKMGRQTILAVSETTDLELVAAVDVAGAGEDAFVAAGLPSGGVTVETDLAAQIEATSPAVAVDFTSPETVMSNVRTCVTSGVACVVGTTGLSPDDLEEISAVCQQYGTPCLVASNFSVGAILMIRCAEQAAR